MGIVGTVLGAVSSVATTVAPILSVAGQIYSMVSSSGKKSGGGGGTAIQPTPTATAPAEDEALKRRRAVAAQKAKGRGGTLLTSGSDASTVGGALRSTLGGA